MPISAGFDHIATVTADLDRVVAFYRQVFDAKVTFEMAATVDHPRMVILDLGGGGALNVTERPAETIVGDRASFGGRGPIDHYGIAVSSRVILDEMARPSHCSGRRGRRDPAAGSDLVAVLPRSRRHGPRDVHSRRG